MVSKATLRQKLIFALIVSAMAFTFPPHGKTNTTAQHHIWHGGNK